MIVVLVLAVDLRTRVEQEIEHVTAFGFDRDMQRLRVTAPIGVRADRVGEVRVGGKHRANVGDLAIAD